MSNSFVNNDYLDPCGTGKTHFTAKAKFPHKKNLLDTNLLYELTQIMVLRVFQVWVEETVKEWVVF